MSLLPSWILSRTLKVREIQPLENIIFGRFVNNGRKTAELTFGRGEIERRSKFVGVCACCCKDSEGSTVPLGAVETCHSIAILHGLGCHELTYKVTGRNPIRVVPCIMALSGAKISTMVICVKCGNVCAMKKYIYIVNAMLREIYTMNKGPDLLNEKIFWTT